MPKLELGEMEGLPEISIGVKDNGGGALRTNLALGFAHSLVLAQTTINYTKMVWSSASHFRPIIARDHSPRPSAVVSTETQQSSTNHTPATEDIPEGWRGANIVPLFKKGNRDNPGNYRPMSLTSVHGFVQGWLCLTNLFEFFEEVMKLIDEGIAVNVVDMDLTRLLTRSLM
eukprot:g43204.t1